MSTMPYVSARAAEHFGSVILTPSNLESVDYRYQHLDGRVLSRSAYPELFTAIAQQRLPCSANFVSTGVTQQSGSFVQNNNPVCAFQPQYQRTQGGDSGYYLAAIMSNSGVLWGDMCVLWAPSTPGGSWSSAALTTHFYQPYYTNRFCMTDNGRLWYYSNVDGTIGYLPYGSTSNNYVNVGTNNNWYASPAAICAGASLATKDMVLVTGGNGDYRVYNGTTLGNEVTITAMVGTAYACMHDGTYWRIYSSNYECFKSSATNPGAGDWTKETNNVTLNGVNCSGGSFGGGMVYSMPLQKYLARPVAGTYNTLYVSDDGVAWSVFQAAEYNNQAKYHEPIWTGSVADGGLGMIIQTGYPAPYPTQNMIVKTYMQCWDEDYGLFCPEVEFYLANSSSTHQCMGVVFNYKLQSGVALVPQAGGAAGTYYKADLDLQFDPATQFCLPKASPCVETSGVTALNLETFGPRSDSNANDGLRAYMKVTR